MKTLLKWFSCMLALTACRSDAIPQAGTGVLNQEFAVALQGEIQVKSSAKLNNNLASIEFVELDDSRCPATAMCVRQGAAIITLRVTPHASAETQTVKLFIGDFMPGDPRNKRNQSADTIALHLADKATYQLILKQVMPYPGTGEAAPTATLVLQKAQ